MTSIGHRAGFRPARLLFPAIIAGAVLLIAQQPTYNIGEVSKEGRPAIAIPDLRGAGEAQAFMAVFNQTLWSDVSGAGIFKMIPKTMYPTTVPQQPADFTQPAPAAEAPRGRKGAQMVQPQSGGGRWMTDWSGPPVSSNYLAFGY